MTTNVFTHVPTEKELLNRIRTSIPSYISGKRLMHTYSVEKEAVRIAEIIFPYLGINPDYLSDISASALLHDIAKQLSDEKQAEICKEYNIEYTSDSAVLHSRTGAYVAKRDFNVNDIVFSSIFCHTTGKNDMNIFEKIIFISDYIEETRTHSSCIEARNYFYQNINTADDKISVLNKTILISIDATLRFLIDRAGTIDIETINARNSVLRELAN